MKKVMPQSSFWRPRPGRWVMIGAGLVFFLLALWQTAHWTRIFELRRIENEAHDALRVYVGDLESELDKFEALPVILAGNPLFVGLVAQPAQSRLPAPVNRELERINRLAQTSAIYVMDHEGVVIASSNWQGPVSFIGEDLSFRPYFKQAINGRPGRYFALGTTSKIRGYYFSAPIRSGGRVSGVITVKVQLRRLEDIWSKGPEKVVVSDHYGVIFITSYAPWKFCSLGPLDREVAQALRKSRRYGDIQPQFLAAAPIRADSRGVALLNIRATMLPDSRRSHRINSSYPYLLQSHDMPDAGWTVHILSDISHVDDQVRNMVLLAGSSLLTLLLSGALVYHRRRTRLERRILEARSRQALERANKMLEQRVGERTEALTSMNRMLRKEVDERQRTEIELRAAQEGLIQAGKLAAIGQMAASITHEVNQPLAAIRMYADNALVLMSKGKIDETRSNLQSITELVGKMGEITGHLKAFARKSPGKNVPVGISHALENALVLLSSPIEKLNVRINCRLPEKEIMVLGDQVRLEQVLVNVIRNSLDAVAMHSKREIRIAVHPEADHVLVVIHDSGPGIADEHLARIFDPFFTRRKDGKGLGLGLSLSLAIIRDSGGTIRAANHPEGGAVVTIELRRAGAAQEEAQ